jgi:hypothetical protein
MFNSSKCDTLREQLNRVLADWANENNIRINEISFKYSDYEAKCTLELAEVDASGDAKIPGYVLDQLKDMLKGTSLEGESPIGHWFRCEDGTVAQLLGYRPYRKFEWQIQYYDKRHDLKDAICSLKYLNMLKDPIG